MDKKKVIVAIVIVVLFVAAIFMAGCGGGGGPGCNALLQTSSKVTDYTESSNGNFKMKTTYSTTRNGC